MNAESVEKDVSDACLLSDHIARRCQHAEKDTPDCLHRGGTEDCPDVCRSIYGNRYTRVLPPGVTS